MPVSNEDVRNAYRWLLGREPDQKELMAWLGADSRSGLRHFFMASREFRNAVLELPPLPADERLPVLRTGNEIEWKTDLVTETKFMEHIQCVWNRLGMEAPHWSVLSSDQFLPDKIDTYSELFYESGRQDLDLLLNILNTNGVDVREIRSMVEYGCGVGRVTPHLAANFQHLTAIDISKSHLAMARKACAKYPDIGFNIVGATDFGMTEPFDLWFSYIVLQHNPPPIIARILERAFKMLAPGGTAIFQVPTWSDKYRFHVSDYLASRADEAQIEVHCLPQNVIFSLANQAGCVPLEVRDDSAMKPPAWASHVFVFRKLGVSSKNSTL